MKAGLRRHGNTHQPGRGSDPIPGVHLGIPTIKAYKNLSGVTGGQVGLSGGDVWDAFLFERPDPYYLYRSTEDEPTADLIWTKYPTNDAVWWMQAIAAFSGGDGTYRSLAPYAADYANDADYRDAEGITICRFELVRKFNQDEFAVTYGSDSATDVDVYVEVTVTLLWPSATAPVVAV